jgi:hypothetical protein
MGFNWLSHLPFVGDTLVNFISSLGTSKDPRSANAFQLTVLSREQLENGASRRNRSRFHPGIDSEDRQAAAAAQDGRERCPVVRGLPEVEPRQWRSQGQETASQRATLLGWRTS